MADNIVEQRYILSRGWRMSILRLCYFTRNSKCQKANYGYRITNNYSMFEENKKLGIKKKCQFQPAEQDSFIVQRVSGQSLSEYEKLAEHTVQFLEKALPIRLSQIVFDFIQDFEGRIWLVHLKACEMERTKTMEDISGGEAKRTLDDLTCSVYCKLCGMIFKKDAASKVLTYKLLWELIQHLKKRGTHLKGIKVSHCSTRPARVCNLCYMLVVGEHELIEIEQQFARSQNVPIQDAVIRVPMDIKPKHRPALLSTTLYQ